MTCSRDKCMTPSFFELMYHLRYVVRWPRSEILHLSCRTLKWVFAYCPALCGSYKIVHAWIHQYCLVVVNLEEEADLGISLPISVFFSCFRRPLKYMFAGGRVRKRFL